jgi:dimethylargininase
LIALTRLPAPSLTTDCLVTFVERQPIDFDEVLRQHAAYREALSAAGCRVVCLPALPELADSTFVEDTAVALPEGVVLCRPGAPERRPEVRAMEEALATDGLAPIVGRIDAPATLDGGDVVRLGGRLLVGRSSRTDDAGIAALAAVIEPLGYRLTEIPVEGVLHLESVCTALDDDTVVVDPAHVDPAALAPSSVIEIHPDEPLGANVARSPGALVASAAAPRTAERLRAAGYEVITVPLSEFEKAEGAATCLSLRMP